MQEFLQNTLQSKLIQNILFANPLPIFKTVKQGDYIIKGISYIYNFYVIKCLKSGILGDGANYTVIKNFKYRKWDTKITDRFIPTNNHYDSATHERLGNYLRCMRDLYNVDLMPFYNCFSNNFSLNIHTKTSITTDATGTQKISYSVVNTGSDDYKIVKIPIKFNQKYTIAIDCFSKAIISPAFLIDDNLLTIDKEDITSTLNVRNPSNIVVSSLRFTKPLVYEATILPNNLPDSTSDITKNTDLALESRLAKYEKKLYLLIQLPTKNTSSITVLEGDYTQDNLNTVVSIDSDTILDDSLINKLCIHNITLLRCNDNLNHPYSSRLIENLLLNVTNGLDLLYENTTRAQQIANAMTNLNSSKSVWDNNFRYWLYKRYIYGTILPKNDVTGCIDKDIDSFLNLLANS